MHCFSSLKFLLSCISCFKQLSVCHPIGIQIRNPGVFIGAYLSHTQCLNLLTGFYLFCLLNNENILLKYPLHYHSALFINSCLDDYNAPFIFLCPFYGVTSAICSVPTPSNKSHFSKTYRRSSLCHNFKPLNLQCCVTLKCTARDSDIFFIFFIKGYYKMLNIILCVIQQVLVYQFYIQQCAYVNPKFLIYLPHPPNTGYPIW